MTRKRQSLEHLLPTHAPAQVNQSLQGGIECLLHLVGADSSVGCSELARQLGMEVTRVSRLLGTLASLGIAERTADRKYRPGPGLHVLSAMSLRGSHLLSAALPHLRMLVESTGNGVALGVLWQRHVCYLFHGGPGRPFEASVAPGRLFPAEQSSIGQILLSHRPEDIRPLFADRMDCGPFIQKLELARSRGYAVGDNGRSIAVAVGFPPVAGLAFSGTHDAAKYESLAETLKSSADRIAAEIERG